MLRSEARELLLQKNDHLSGRIFAREMGSLSTVDFGQFRKTLGLHFPFTKRASVNRAHS